jgi:hypothetical protein
MARPWLTSPDCVRAEPGAMDKGHLQVHSCVEWEG